jgi:succinylarginine dihydrolase
MGARWLSISVALKSDHSPEAIQQGICCYEMALVAKRQVTFNHSKVFLYDYSPTGIVIRV